MGEPAPGAAVRRLVWDVLRAVDTRGAYANLLVPQLVRERGVATARDRALVTELAYGTLRAQGTLDHVLGLVASRPVDGIDPGLRDALRLGAYQLLRTRIPQHAAVSATVDLAREVAGPGPAQFANAVLRRVAERASNPDPLGAPDPASDPIGHLAVTTAHPRWVVEAFRDALGGDLDETTEALQADDTRPHTHLVARPGRITRDELVEEVAAAGFTAGVGSLSPYALHLDGGDPSALASVRSGRAAVQDEGSQLVALALTRVDAPPGPVVDLCAGPGGKTALLAGELPSSPLVAVELQPHRARLVRRALDGGDVVIADGRAAPLPTAMASRVLVDAPCTGLGALRRRPEARWRRQPDDVGRLAALQRELLGAAVRLTAPGGVIAYVVCSPHLAETQAVVGDVVAGSAVELIDARTTLPGVPSLDGATIQLWPHRHGTDAMFLALLRRR